MLGGESKESMLVFDDSEEGEEYVYININEIEDLD